MKRTWRAVAPSVRRVASSRARWATVIESVFAMTNAPTNRAMPAKASRKSRNVSSTPFESLKSACACWPPVRTRVCGGSTERICASSAPVATPCRAATSIWSSSPRSPKSRCAVRRSKAEIVPPASEVDVPKSTTPLTR